MADNRFVYVIRHRRAFRQVERQLTGKVSLRGYLHDIDKLIMYCFLPRAVVRKIHKTYARHHLQNARTHEDYIQMIVDWESGRITKNNISARDFLYMKYPGYADKVEPVLKELGL